MVDCVPVAQREATVTEPVAELEALGKGLTVPVAHKVGEEEQQRVEDRVVDCVPVAQSEGEAERPQEDALMEGVREAEERESQLVLLLWWWEWHSWRWGGQSAEYGAGRGRPKRGVPGKLCRRPPPLGTRRCSILQSIYTVVRHLRCIDVGLYAKFLRDGSGVRASDCRSLGGEFESPKPLPRLLFFSSQRGRGAFCSCRRQLRQEALSFFAHLSLRLNSGAPPSPLELCA